MEVTINNSVTEFPATVMLETRTTCNSRCSFCPHRLTDRNRHVGIMSDELFQKIINECARYQNLEYLVLSFQNEPLMDPSIFDRIGYARRVTRGSPKIKLMTNGSLLTRKRVDELVKSPPDILKISMYGIDQETYENTMVGLNFSRTLRNIDYLVKQTKLMEKLDLQITTVYTDEIARVGYKRLYDYWSKKGLRLHLINVENRAGALHNGVKIFSNQEWRVRSWCERPLKQLCILTTGEVVLCCAIWNKEAVLGNVNHQTLYEIWNGDTINRYRSKLGNRDVEDLFPCNICMQADIIIDGERIQDYKGFVSV